MLIMASVKTYFNELGYSDISELMILHTANAIAYYRNIEKDIDKLYESRKYEFYKMAVESTVYNNAVSTQLNLHEEIYTKKMLGILLVAEEDNDIQQQVVQIIKKANGKIYACIKAGKPQEYIAEMIMGGLDFSLMHSATFLMIYLMIVIKDKEKMSEEDRRLITYTLEEYREKQVTADTEGIIRSIEKGIKDNNEFLKALQERIGENKGTFESYTDITLSRNEDIKKLDTIVALLFELENLSSSNIMGQIKLTNKDVEQILMAYKLMYNDKNLERSTNILINGILVKSLIKAYKNVKEIYFKNNRETLFLDLEYLEEKLKDSENRNKLLEEKLAALEKENNKLKLNLDSEIRNAEKNFNKEAVQLRKDFNELKVKYENEVKNRNELNELREMMFEIKQEYIPEKVEISLEDLTKDKKVAIIGGTNDWRMKIKDKYSNFITIDGFNEGFDANILNNMNFIFFYTGYMNHGTYYKVINVARNKEILFGYIGKTNVELIEREMADILKKHGF